MSSAQRDFPIDIHDTFSWRFRRTRAVVLTLAMLAACDRKPKIAATDSAAAQPAIATVDSLRPKVGTGWEGDAGPFLVLPTVDGGRDAGSLLRPDATDSTVGDTTGLRRSAGDGTLELFSRASLMGVAKLVIEKAPPGDSGCTAWPVARLTSADGTMPRGWTAAFLKGRVTLVPLDSIDGLAPKDSAALAANISRLASSLSDDTVATFHGLPFVVLRAFRGLSDGRGFVVTTLVRRVNQEDDPREERLVMVIDGDRATPAAWTVGWHERASGREDELVVSEPLSAFLAAGKGRTHLLFGRDDGESLSAAMLVRDARGWQVLWESALAGCER
jgi:hypothetical protein